jgi:ribosome-associated protein
MKEIEVSKEPVELFKILKFEGLAASGGEAKALIADGQVLVNGQVETRKRKQIVSGDILEFAGEKHLVRLKS